MPLLAGAIQMCCIVIFPIKINNEIFESHLEKMSLRYIKLLKRRRISNIQRKLFHKLGAATHNHHMTLAEIWVPAIMSDWMT